MTGAASTTAPPGVRIGTSFGVAREVRKGRCRGHNLPIPFPRQLLPSPTASQARCRGSGRSFHYDRAQEIPAGSGGGRSLGLGDPLHFLLLLFLLLLLRRLLHEVHQLELASAQLGEASLPLSSGFLGAFQDVVLDLTVLGHLDDGVQGLALKVPEVLLHVGFQLQGTVLRGAFRPELLGQLLEVPHERSAQSLLSVHAVSPRVQLVPQLPSRAPSGCGSGRGVQVFVT